MTKFADEVFNEFIGNNPPIYKCAGLTCTECPFFIDSNQNEVLWYGTNRNDFTGCVLTYMARRNDKLKQQ